MIKKRDFKNFIMCVIIILVAIIMVLAFIQNISVIRNCTNRIVQESLKDEIKQNNNYIKAYLNNSIDIVESECSRISADKLNNKFALTEEVNMALRKMNFSEAEFIDDKGNMYYTDGTIRDVRDKTIFLKSYNLKNTYICNPIGESNSNYNCIGISVPIFIDNKYYGSIYVVNDLYKLKSYIKDSFNYDNGFVYVIDDKGYVIFRVNNGYDDENCINFYHYMAYGDVDLKKYSDCLQDDIKYNRSTTIEITSDSGMGYFGYAPVLSNSNWTIVSYIKQNQMTKLSTELSDKTIEIVTSVTIMIMLVAFYIVMFQLGKSKQLKKVAFRDNLTGINNRLGFIEHAKNCFKKYPKTDYAVVMFDIKKFKYINYKYGYDYGDNVIKNIAISLQEKYSKDEVCARVESDVFVILIKNEQGFEKNLKDTLEEVIMSDLGILSFRYGIYKDIDKKQTLTDILEKAKLAWKFIKNDTKNDVSYYDEKLLREIIDEEKLESKMENALQNGEFKVYIQPKIDLLKDKICGGEALVRWISKDMGFMPPDTFIPLFEKNGFVFNIDFYMLEEVFKFIAMLKKKNIHNITISVNQSRETINHSEYLEKMRYIVNKYDVDPKYIELEITESVFVESHKSIISIVKKLKDIGFKMSMDDFGSGYSSLNLLSEMPIDVLKIDRLFLNSTEKSENSKVIIKSVIDMARNLDIDVVCEGVENVSQVDFLKKSNCQMAQGYFYSKPVPIDDFKEMIFLEKNKT